MFHQCAPLTSLSVLYGEQRLGPLIEFADLIVTVEPDGFVKK
jgi:hypothetical protein